MSVLNSCTGYAFAIWTLQVTSFVVRVDVLWPRILRFLFQIQGSAANTAEVLPFPTPPRLPACDAAPRLMLPLPFALIPSEAVRYSPFPMSGPIPHCRPSRWIAA